MARGIDLSCGEERTLIDDISQGIYLGAFSMRD